MQNTNAAVGFCGICGILWNSVPIPTALGAVPSPFDCFLCNRGLKTLHIRMKLHFKNGLAVAKFLESHPRVEKVIYPGGWAGIWEHPRAGIWELWCWVPSSALEFTGNSPNSPHSRAAFPPSAPGDEEAVHGLSWDGHLLHQREHQKCLCLPQEPEGKIKTIKSPSEGAVIALLRGG